jgi:hypothetical protein
MVFGLTRRFRAVDAKAFPREKHSFFTDILAVCCSLVRKLGMVVDRAHFQLAPIVIEIAVCRRVGCAWATHQFQATRIQQDE